MNKINIQVKLTVANSGRLQTPQPHSCCPLLTVIESLDYEKYEKLNLRDISKKGDFAGGHWL